LNYVPYEKLINWFHYQSGLTSQVAFIEHKYRNSKVRTIFFIWT